MPGILTFDIHFKDKTVQSRLPKPEVVPVQKIRNEGKILNFDH